MATVDETMRRKQFILFLLVGALLGITSGVYENTFNNYLDDVYHISEKARGFLEFPRELPGFLVAFFSGLLCFLATERMGALAIFGIGLGLLGQAFLAPSYGWVILWMVIWSWGTHMFMPLQSAIGMSMAKDGQYGRRLGQLQGINTLAVVFGCGLIWLLYEKLHWNYAQLFITAAVFAFLAAAVMLLMRPQAAGETKQRFVFKKCYMKFYLLNVLWGARKQVFLTFAPWVLVKVYDQPPTKFAQLILIASIVSMLLQPLFGRMLDYFGERLIFLAEGWGIIFVCVGYAAAAKIFGVYALQALFVFYMLDRFLMVFSMARATYLKKILDDPGDLTPTLSLGVTIDHLVSMTIPFFGGLLWESFGYPAVFIAGAVIAIGNLLVAWRIKGKSAVLGTEMVA